MVVNFKLISVHDKLDWLPYEEQISYDNKVGRDAN